MSCHNFKRRFSRNSVGHLSSMEDLISIGQVDTSDTLGTTLHHSALNGSKKALKKVLDKGIHVDYPNDEGQTPLFCACLHGHDNVVEYLLSAGAEPNEKSNIGLTPMHAACYSGHVKSLMQLLKAGADMRLHDYQGRGVKDWAMLNPTPKKRMKILEFLDKTRLFAMSSSGQDLLMKKASSKTLHKAQNRKNSVTKILRDRIGRPSIHQNLEKMACSHHSIGFGQVYANGTDTTGFISAIPLVTEHSLRHDKEGETYNNGAFSVMESMWWDYSKVTVKRLHRDLDPYQGGVVDLLINEIEHIGKLRHPNILTLMGVCQTSNLDGLILVYETVTEGSLYNYLHQKMERLPSQMIQDIAMQMCDAVIFIHLRGLVHCALTSHAISLVNLHAVKLGNFEYMIESSKCEWGKKNAVATNTAENAVYNWMAPEVMINMPPSFYCDMFSYCAILWEIFHGEVPFDNQCSETIKSHYSKGNGLKIYNGKMQDYYKIMLEYGLQQDPTNRKLSFLHARDLLLASPKDAEGYIKAHLKHLHPSDNKGSGQIKSPDKPTRQTPTSHPSAPPREPAPTSRYMDPTSRDNQKKDRGRPDQYEEEMSYGGATDKRREMERKKRDKQDHQDRENRRGRNENYGEAFSTKSRQVGAPNNNNNNCYVEPAHLSWRENDGLDMQDFVLQKPARQLHYSADGLSWESFPREVGEEYVYTIQVKREPSPSKNTNNAMEINQVYVSRDEVERQTFSTRDEVERHREAYTSRDEMEKQVYSTKDEVEKQRERPCVQPAPLTSSDNISQSESAESSIDSTQFARGRELERKTSSMGNFSYMQLDNHQRTRSAGAKPACHGQSEPVTELYSTAGKLTTAGSLYALYNEHSPDVPLGQLEHRRDHRHFSTLPRTNNTPNVESDPSWFGGRDSVRDLAQVFQQQIQQHGYYQSVLDGTVNKNHSNEQLKPSTDYGTHANTGQPDNGSCPERQCSLGSLTTVSMNEGENVHQIAFDVNEDSSSTFISGADRMGSGATIDSSTESDIVTKWVDHELKKIKRHLSEEIMSQHSLNTVQSPDLFDRSDNNEYNQTAGQSHMQYEKSENNEQLSEDDSNLVTPDTSDTSLTRERHDTGDHIQKSPVHEFYFDDELYQAETRTSPVRSSREPYNRPAPVKHLQVSSNREPQTQPHSSQAMESHSEDNHSKPTSVIKSNLPMKTILKKTNSSSDESSKGFNTEKAAGTKKRLSKIPTSSRSNITSKPKLTEGGAYTNIVTVRSSLEDAGVHQVTHKMTNLKTGGSKTLLNDTVNAKKVVTRFKAVQ